MAINTTNYNLVKPALSDTADIAVINTNMDTIDTTLKSNADAIEAHKTDYISNIPYSGTTGGTANTYTISTPAITTLNEGMAVSVKIHADSTGTSTLNWNGKGAKTIKKPNGNNMTTLKANGIYTLRYDGSAFILQGEGGEYGTATASQVLAGATFGTENGVISGTASPKVPNTIINGSFENDLNCWNTQGSSLSINTTYSKFGTKSIKILNPVQYDHVNQSVKATSGHIYYLSHWYKTISVGIGSHYSDTYFYDINNNTLTGGTLFFSNSAVDWTLASLVLAAPVNTSSLRINVNGYTGTDNACEGYADGVMIVDLTATFGAGKEPTKALMDAMVQMAGGWWDSDLAILTADATATASQIVTGYYAYSGGQKLLGTYNNLILIASGNYRTLLSGQSTNTSSTTYVTKKSFTMGYSGSIRIRYGLQSPNSVIWGRLLINGTTILMENSASSGGGVTTFTQDININAGDAIEVQIKAVTAAVYLYGLEVGFTQPDLFTVTL